MKFSIKSKRSWLATIFFCSIATFLSAQGEVLITEFMASNSVSLLDEDGDSSDWLELYNAGDEAINLDGWFLTDKADNLDKWRIPEVTLDAGAYLLIFASEKDRDDPASELHTNFKLSAAGEFLAIVKPDGVTISHGYDPSFPSQLQDISYGLFQGQLVFFNEPTPGAENVLGSIVQTPVFSHSRGFYDDTFQLSLSAIGDDVDIYYTTNGTRPTQENGTQYTGPINIETTTPFSAVAVDQDGFYSQIMTHTYLFIEDIVQQPNDPAGYPDEWGPFRFSDGNAPADYEMDPEVVNDSEYADLMPDALTSIPTISIVTNIGYMFSHEIDMDTGGIYIYTGNTGAGGAGMDWERPASIEYFDPNTAEEFQVNCGLRLHGGNSRIPDNSQKHSFRVSFRSQYGPSKLRYDLFEEPTATNEFNALVFRAGYNYSWVKNSGEQRENAQYLQDPFAKMTQRALGQPSPHEKFVHLYLNGLYWGLYNISEKLTNDFMESYLNGDEDDFDVIKDHGLVVDGSWTAWTHLHNQAEEGLGSNENYQKVQGRNPDGAINPDFENLLDIENLITYMQYNMYIGNIDWDHNNWFAARNRVTNDAGFRFFAWDAETSMTDVNHNCVDENNEENPSWFYHLMQENDDFRILFADHIQQNFFNGGPLTPEATAARYQALADEIDLAIIAESARWGDYRRDVDVSDNDHFLYTRNDFWLPRLEDLLNNYFPNRTAIVVQQWVDIGLFPAIQAPAFSHYGGDMSEAIDLEMTTNYGDIYYTTDGSDPREWITGNISGQAQMYTGEVPIFSQKTVKARAKFGNEWSPITQATYNYTTDVNAPDALGITGGSFPNPFSKSTTIYYSLPESGSVQIDIYTVDGRMVTSLFSGVQAQGYHEVHWHPTQQESGVFVYRIKTEEQVLLGKVVRE